MKSIFQHLNKLIFRFIIVKFENVSGQMKQLQISKNVLSLCNLKMCLANETVPSGKKTILLNKCLKKLHLKHCPTQTIISQSSGSAGSGKASVFQGWLTDLLSS